MSIPRAGTARAARCQYVVRVFWLECAAADAGWALDEDGIELGFLIYALRGSPLFPPRSIPPEPPIPIEVTPASRLALIRARKAWYSDREREAVGRPRGLRKDTPAVWARRAGWAWDHHARGQSWRAIAQRELHDAERRQEIREGAAEAVTVGCDDADPKVMFTGLLGMVQAYADLGTARPGGELSAH